MAHLRSLATHCQEVECRAGEKRDKRGTASVELVSDDGAPLGKFCRKCGSRHLIEQNRHEARVRMGIEESTSALSKRLSRAAKKART